MLKIIRYATITLIVVILGQIGYTKYQEAASEKEAEQVREVQIGADFILTNQDGVKTNSQNFRGKLMLVYFGFTNCPSMCPTDMAVMTQAMQELGEYSEQVVPMLITIDPDRDDVEAMKSYVSNFHPATQGFTGTKEEIVKVASDYRVFYQKVTSETLSDYLMNHSGYMYLMGRDGKYLAHFNHGQDAGEIAAGVRKYL